MSDAPDFAAILGDRLAHSIQGEPITGIHTPTGAGTYQLAAKVPELCPDCKGRGRTAAVRRLSLPVDCSHPNAPTIGRMLAEWQPLMVLAEYARHLIGCDVGIHGRGEFCSCGLDAARAALQEVRHG